LFSFATSITRS